MDETSGRTAEFQVIVVGGGTAGAVCAATLALRGVRTLLIAETAKLGHNVRSVEVDGHRGTTQHPWWHIGVGGGYWARVVREQNLPTRIHPEPTGYLSVKGLGELYKLPVVLSAGGILDVLLKLLPIPMDDATRHGVERILYLGLDISWPELAQMDQIPIGTWLQDNKASDMATMIVETLTATYTGLPPDAVSSQASVFGAFGGLRSMIGGQGFMAAMEPDIQLGFVEPLGQRVESMGGTVWRSTHVDRILVEGGRAVGVRMKDGREARAPHVAMAVGNPRLPALFEQLPTEVEAPLRKEAPYAVHELSIFTVLKKPVVTLKDFLVVVNPGGLGPLYLNPLHEMTPWGSPDERQFCLSWVNLPPGPTGEDVARHPEPAVKLMDEFCEELFPGWIDAIDHRKMLQHRHAYVSPMLVGPRVPRRSPTISGLWYVGEGSAPVAGLGIEQAAYAGYDGAVTIAEELGFGLRRLDLLFGDT